MRKTKILSLALAFLLIASFALPTFAETAEYSDVHGHWAEGAITRWSEKKIVQGADGSFSPDAPLTRAQLAAVLDKLLVLGAEAENTFSDIPSDAWYAQSVLRCNAAGILQGDGKLARPDEKITREAAMTMLCRALDIKVSANPELSVFKDCADVSDWAAPYVHALTSRSIVGGVGEGMLAPKADMTRAALMVVLDNAVIQYITESGEYEAENGEGIILISTPNVKLNGTTKAAIAISPAVDDKTVDVIGVAQLSSAFNDKTVVKMSAGSSSSGGGRKKASKKDDLEISKEGEITGGKYDNVTITDSVADGEIVLTDLEIEEDLIIQGGGSESVKLVNCKIGGRVIMAKEKGEAPRLSLTNTPVNKIEVQKPAIIEAEDEVSQIGEIKASDNLEIKGENTEVAAVVVVSEEEKGTEITVTLNDSTVGAIEAKAAVNIEGENGNVDKVIAEAAVTVSADVVADLEIPESAEEKVVINVSDNIAIEITVNSQNGVVIFGAKVILTTDKKSEDGELDITLNDEEVTHVHKWGEPEETASDCEKDGEILYTCITCPVCTDEGCEHTDCITEAFTKKEVIPALGHKWGEWESSGDALHVRKCENDAEHYEKEEHSFGAWEKADESLHKAVCSVCAADAFKEHEWDEGIITTEPTADADGVKTYTCDICSATQTEAVPRYYELDLTERIESVEYGGDYWEITYSENKYFDGELRTVQIPEDIAVYFNNGNIGELDNFDDRYVWTDNAEELLMWADAVVLRSETPDEYTEIYVSRYYYDVVTEQRWRYNIIYCEYEDYYLEDYWELEEIYVFINGEEGVLPDLREGDVLTFAWENCEDFFESSFVYIYASRNAISGEVTSAEENEAEMFVYKFNNTDEEYVTWDYEPLGASVGDSGEFSLTHDGKLIKYVPSSEIGHRHDLHTYKQVDESGHEVICSECGFVDAVDEHYWEIESKTEPTEEADGETNYSCRYCDAVKNEIVPFYTVLNLKNWIDYAEAWGGYYEIEYYENGDYSNDAKEIEIDEDMELFVNGAPAGTLGEIDAAIAWTADGSELLETAHNVELKKRYDSTEYEALYVTRYDYDMVESVDADNLTINGMYNTISLDAKDRDGDFNYKIFLDGEEISLSDLKEKDVLNMAWENVNGEWDKASFVNIYVTRNIINGQITEKNRSYGEDAWYYVINERGAEYKTFDDEKLVLEMGIIGDFYMTIDNKIFMYIEK